jgi:sulfur carrier protein
VADLLQQLGAPRFVAVELNLEVIPRARHAETILKDGDKIELVTLVGGG